MSEVECQQRQAASASSWQQTTISHRYDSAKTDMAEAEQTPATPAAPSCAPTPGVRYPIKVDYCPNCSIPFEYCEFYPDYEGCKAWLEKNMPEKFAELTLGEDAAGGDDEEKKRQKRGGKGQVKAKKKETDVDKRILLSIAPRGKKKAVTVVQGLKSFGIDLKVASKFFGQKFACGASITGDDEIVIQGDFKDEVAELIPEKWPEVDEDLIEDLGEKKR